MEERKLQLPGALELAACDVRADSKATGGRLIPSVRGYKEMGRSSPKCSPIATKAH